MKTNQIYKKLLHLLCALACSLSGQEGNDSGYNEYTSAVPGLTHIESWGLLDGSWYGPLYLKNTGEELLQLLGYVSNCDCLQVIAMPDSIGPNEVGKIEAIFSPEAIGLYTARLTFSTNLGERRAVLRANVVADNPYVELSLKWRDTRSYDRLLKRYLYPAKDLIKDIKENPDDWIRMLVDPRPASQFGEAHATGAINMQLHELLHRNELKPRRIFIIDSGVQSMATFNEIRRLESLGFEQLFWVDGGLNQWSEKGGTLAGAPSSIERWRRLLPSHLYNSLLRDDFIILAIQPLEETLKLEGIFHGLPVLFWQPIGVEPGQQALSGYRKNLIEQLEQLSAGASRPILLVSQNESGSIKVMSDLEAAGLKNLYVLEGGVNAIEKYLTSISLSREEKQYLVRSGAKNPKGKVAPRKITDNDCADCP